MKNISKVIAVFLFFTFFLYQGCESNHEKPESEHPVVVEEIEGTDLSTVTLTEKAIERIGLETAVVSEVNNSPKKLVIPYSSIIYDRNGVAWVYKSLKTRTFVRHKIDVDFIKGNNAFLNDGPLKGTVIATVGVAELYGSEFKIGH